MFLVLRTKVITRVMFSFAMFFPKTGWLQLPSENSLWPVITFRQEQESSHFPRLKLCWCFNICSSGAVKASLSIILQALEHASVSGGHLNSSLMSSSLNRMEKWTKSTGFAQEKDVGASLMGILHAHGKTWKESDISLHPRAAHTNVKEGEVLLPRRSILTANLSQRG